MSEDWADRIAPTSLDVVCGSEIHQLLWQAGALRLPAHSDPEAERALAGLGGQRCRCVELLDAWSACSGDPRVLMIGPRGSDAHPAWPDSPARRARLARSASSDPLTAVLSMGDQIPRRLVATVAHTLAEYADHPSLRPLLHVGVATRVQNAIRRWQPGTRPEVVLELIRATAERSLSGSAGDTLVASLPVEWLTEVWAPGLDVRDDEFTLSAQRNASGTIELITVDRTMTCHVRTP